VGGGVAASNGKGTKDASRMVPRGAAQRCSAGHAFAPNEPQSLIVSRLSSPSLPLLLFNTFNRLFARQGALQLAVVAARVSRIVTHS
jgi:hypothetical protein